MDLQVFASPALANEARRFLAPFAVNSIVSSMQEIHEGSLHGDQVLIYMSGREDEQELTKPLKRLARVKRLRTVVLYAGVRTTGTSSMGRASRNGHCRTIPSSVHGIGGCSGTEAAARNGTAIRHSATGHTIDVEALRRALGLTQAQLATAIGVAERTVQNWESGRVSPQAERRLRDLVEVNEALERYLAEDQRQAWLISPNDAFAGDAPRDWIV